MGILSDSYASNKASSKGAACGPTSAGAELPGGLSFAIRELSEDELEKCKAPEAIEALDFLQLQYKAPPVIEAILTPSSLNKYDRIFRYLLRLVRLQAVVAKLLRDATGRNAPRRDGQSIVHKFRVDAYHFVTTLSHYSSASGIEQLWMKLEPLFARTERCLARGDYDGVVASAKSIHILRDLHKSCLDRMLHRLFLNKSHSQVMKLIENILGCILRFEVIVRDGNGAGDGSTHEEAVLQLYQAFRKETGLFMRFLRDVDGKGHGVGPTMEDVDLPSTKGDVFEHLLLRLEMKQYY